MRGLWLSINPRWIDAIITGRKTVELRRRAPHVEHGALGVLYSTSPISKLVAIARVESVVRKPLDSLWSEFEKSSAVSRTEFLQYFDGLSEGAAIKLASVETLVEPIDLGALRAIGMEPAQGWRYLDAPAARALLDLAGSRNPMSNTRQTNPPEWATALQDAV